MTGFESIRVGTIRTAIIVGAALLVLLLLAARASSAEADGVPGRGAVFGAEVKVLERGGLPPAQAARGIEVQTAIDEARLVPRLEAAMGDAFAGVWYQADSAELHVGVTSAASRQMAEGAAESAGLAARVVEVPVSSTWAEITAAKEEWVRNLGGLLRANQAMIWPQPETNSLEVRLASTVPPATLAALRLEAAAASVEVNLARTLDANFGVAPKAQCKAFAKAKAFCDPTITAGVTLKPAVGGNCTYGPAVIKDPLGANTTETFILTAGHCIEGAGEKSETSNKAEVSKLVGKAVVALDESIGSEVDVGVVKVENSEWMNATQTPVNPAVASWGAAESNPNPVTGQKKPVVGAASCRSGQTTGTTCGKVNKDELAIGTLKELVELREVGKKAESGDSGGPFFAEEKAGLLAEGTLVGNLVVNEVETEWPLFEPLWFSFKQLEPSGVTYKLLTTANQTRPKCPMPAMERCVYAESNPATLTGSQLGSNVFTVKAGTVKCGTITYSGTLAEQAESFELAPSYSECTAFGFVSTTIDVNGCKYKTTATSKIEADKFNATVDVVCPEGKAITVTAFNCYVKIGSQTGWAATLTDTTSASPKKDVDASVSATGIAYTQESKSFPGCTTGSFTDGKYSGETTVKADNAGGEAIGIEVG